MLWGGICSFGKRELCIIPRTLNANGYIEVYNDYFLLHTQQCYGEEYIFMHDSAPFHRAKVVTECLKNNNVNVLEWPAFSPDLEPIENIWEVLARLVFGDRKQYNTVAELCTAVLREWENIPHEMCRRR